MSERTQNAEGRPGREKTAPSLAARLFRATLTALLAAMAAAGAMLLVEPRASSGWLTNALTSRLFWVCAILMLGSLSAILMVLRFLAASAGRRRGVRLASQGGAAIVEFALALPILLVLVLTMAQSTLLMAGNLCVHYAAFCAARTAVVQIPHANASEAANIIADSTSSPKYSRIKTAAVWAVLPVSCGSSAYPSSADASSLTSGLSQAYTQAGSSLPAWLQKSLPYRLAYATDNTVVTLDAPAPRNGGIGQDVDPNAYLEHEDIVVHVDHTYYLSIPYINRIFMGFGGSDGRTLDFATGSYGLVIHAVCRLPNEGVQDWIDVETFGG